MYTVPLISDQFFTIFMNVFDHTDVGQLKFLLKEKNELAVINKEI